MTAEVGLAKPGGGSGGRGAPQQVPAKAPAGTLFFLRYQLSHTVTCCNK
jgi:GTPase involved in cell partitioning and DNA repair